MGHRMMHWNVSTRRVCEIQDPSASRGDRTRWEALEVYFISFSPSTSLRFPSFYDSGMVYGEREFIKCADLNIWLVSVFIPAMPLPSSIWHGFFSSCSLCLVVCLISILFFPLLGYFYFFRCFFFTVTFPFSLTRTLVQLDGRTHSFYIVSSLLFQ